MLSNEIFDLSSSTPGIEPPAFETLPPDWARDVMIARYITVASATIFFWDAFINIVNDHDLLVEHRIRLPTLVYFTSRICCCFFVITALIVRFISIFSSASLCIILDRIVVVFYCATVVFSSLLFFFRTRAVFSTYPRVIALFACLWVAVLGGCLPFIVYILKPIRTPPGPPSNIPVCLNGGINPYAAAATIIPLINDTLVFVAITWRLSLNSYYSYTLQGGLRFIFCGDYVPIFSKVLLRDGQAYYLTVVTMNVITVTTLFLPIPGILRSICGVPNAVMTNVMASRVYINTILEIGREREMTFFSASY